MNVESRAAEGKERVRSDELRNTLDKNDAEEDMEKEKLLTAAMRREISRMLRAERHEVFGVDTISDVSAECRRIARADKARAIRYERARQQEDASGISNGCAGD
jgi:hypothetical protein